MIENLSERVEKLLSEKKISKTEISKKLGIGYSTLWRRLNGSRNVNVDFLTELANILGTTPSYLMGEANNPNFGNEGNEMKKNAPISIIKPEEQRGMLSFSYWRDVSNSVKEIADSGDKDAIDYVSKILGRALSLLHTKLDGETVSHSASEITNAPVMLGHHNENNLMFT